VHETEIRSTSPVGMYRQGASYPFGLMDLAGNVWEWTGSWYDKGKDGRVVRGGSWHYVHDFARVSVRDYYVPHLSDGHIGCRGVAPVFSGS
jgi:formylglycine-generating enzyme required for sulfatase activity